MSIVGGLQRVLENNVVGCELWHVVHHLVFVGRG